MNALQYSFNYLMRQSIPVKILELAFPQKSNGMILSIEDRMLNDCIRPIVMMDMSILGGMMIHVDLSLCRTVATNEYTLTPDMNTFIVDVPKSLTNNKTIVSVYSLIAGGYGTNVNIAPCTNPIVADASKLYLAGSPSNVLQTARMAVVGENKVLIEGYAPQVTTGTLVCNVSNNANLENIQPPYYIYVAKMITLGIKAYIYNNLWPMIDTGILYAGHELAGIKDIVSSYADAESMYEEERIRWARMSVLNDSRKKTVVVNTLISMMA